MVETRIPYLHSVISDLPLPPGLFVVSHPFSHHPPSSHPTTPFLDPMTKPKWRLKSTLSFCVLHETLETGTHSKISNWTAQKKIRQTPRLVSICHPNYRDGEIGVQQQESNQVFSLGSEPKRPRPRVFFFCRMAQSSPVAA